MKFLLLFSVHLFVCINLTAQSTHTLTDLYTQEAYTFSGMEEIISAPKLNPSGEILVEYPVFSEQALLPKVATLNKNIRDLYITKLNTDSLYNTLQAYGSFYRKTCYGGQDAIIPLRITSVSYAVDAVFAHVIRLQIRYQYAEENGSDEYGNIIFRTCCYLSLDDGKAYRVNDFFVRSAIPTLEAQLKPFIVRAVRQSYFSATDPDDGGTYSYHVDAAKLTFTLEDFDFSMNSFRFYFRLNDAGRKISICRFNPLPEAIELTDLKKSINPNGPLKRVLLKQAEPLPGIRNVNIPQQYEQMDGQDVLKPYHTFSPYQRAPIPKLRSLNVYHNINESDNITDTTLYLKATYFYDAAGFMTGYREYLSKDTAVYQINTCTYNSKHLLTSIRSHSSTDYGAWSKTMVYDSRNNLISVTQELEETSVTRYLYTGNVAYELIDYSKKEHYHQDHLSYYLLDDAGNLIRNQEETFVYAANQMQQRYRTDDSTNSNATYIYERVNGISRIKQIQKPGVQFHYLYNDYNTLLRITCFVGPRTSAYKFTYSREGFLQDIFYYEPNSDGHQYRCHFQYAFW